MENDEKGTRVQVPDSPAAVSPALSHPDKTTVGNDGKVECDGVSQKTCQVRRIEKAFEEKAFNAPVNGVYLIQVGNKPAKKIVVKK